MENQETELPEDEKLLQTENTDEDNRNSNREFLPAVEEDAEEEPTPLLVLPPDGGYGWVIVVASFLANMMVDGIAYAYGVLLVELVAYFEESKAKVSLVGSLLAGIYLCTGPISAAFVQLYGCRKVTMVGGVISCLGLALSVAAPNVETLILTYGVMGGFGFGLVYLPSTIIVNLYFEKRRSLAVGIAVCGSGFGVIVFAPFMTLLMEIYDWKNTMLILAGLMLNCVVFGALYRPLTPPTKVPDVATSDNMAGSIIALSRRNFGSVGSADRSRHTSMCEGVDERQRNMSSNEDKPKGPGAAADIIKYMKDTMTEHQVVQHNSDKNLDKLLRVRTQSECRGSTRRLTDVDPIAPSRETQLLIYSTPNLGAKKSTIGAAPEVVAIALPPTIAKPEEYTKPMNRKDIFYTGSVFQMNRLGSFADNTMDSPRQRSVTNIAASNQMIGSWIMSMTRLPEDDETGRRSCFQRLPKSIRDVIVQMTDFSLLKNLPYLLTWSGNILFMIGYYVPFFLMFDFAVIHNGVPENQASLLLSIIGIMNTSGRVFFGWLVGFPTVSTLLVNNLTIFFSGVITVFVPFCTIYPLMMVYAVLYGLLVAPIISLTSEILCDMFGIDKLTNAFGLLTLARGLSASAGPPIAGFLYDATGRFDIPYYTAGGVIIASGFLFFLLHLPKFQQKMLSNIKEMENQQLAVIRSTTGLDQDHLQTSV